MAILSALLGLFFAASVPTDAIRPVTVLTGGRETRGSCVLVYRQDREHDVALYFLTAASLFRTADGERAAAHASIVGEAGNAIDIASADVILSPARTVNLAILKATVPSSTLVPQPLALAPPESGQAFRIVGAPGTIDQVAEHIRFRSTLILTGDRDASGLSACVGAPAMSSAGIFGIVGDCEAGRAPVISLLSVAGPFLLSHIPGMQLAPATSDTSVRDVAGPTILVPCGEPKSGEIDVPFDRHAAEVPVFATATFIAPPAIRLGDLTVVRLDERTVKLRFTLAGTPPPPFGTTCQPGQALVSVRVNVVVNEKE